MKVLPSVCCFICLARIGIVQSTKLPDHGGSSFRLLSSRSRTEQPARAYVDNSAGGDPSDDDKEETGDFDSMEAVMLWKVRWPAETQVRRPSADSALSGQTREWQLEMLVVFAFFGMGSVILWRFAVRTGATEQSWWRKCCPPSAAAQQDDFGTHLAALVQAIAWRHCHRRAILGHLWRIAVPALVLVLLHSLRSKLLAQVAESGPLGETAKFTGLPPQHIVDSILDFAFSISLVPVVMMTMASFSWHMAAEAETGFRHLLHISGLSRQAYFTAAFGLDGVVQAVVSLLVVAILAGSLSRVRVVLWTSPILLVGEVILLATVTTLLGYLMSFCFRSAKYTSTAANFLFVFVTISVPFTMLGPVVPTFGQQSWKAIAVPVIPAYRSFFELIAGCSKGRCLGLDDVSGALTSGQWVSPWGMIVGQGAEQRLEITPPEALVSFAFMVLAQMALIAALVTWLDVRRHPALHGARVHDGNPEGAHQRGGALEVNGLVHSYNWLSSAQNRILNGVSFSVPHGCTLGLLGPNGAGKTTVIRCITGEEAPQEGTISITRSGAGAYVGLCPQETILNHDLTVGENLMFFAHLRGKWGLEARECVDRVLAATKLEEKRAWLPDTLSGGMRRRLAVGCTMVATPAVVILDEPTTGLDPMTRRGVWETVQDARASGSCCLLTSHMMEEAEFLSSHIVVLVKGSVAAAGTVQQLKEEWGTGYALRIESELGREAMARDFVASLLPKENREAKQGAQPSQMTFRMTGDGEALGHLIIAIHQKRVASGIRHWGVSQATLEETYLQIVQQQSLAHQNPPGP